MKSLRSYTMLTLLALLLTGTGAHATAQESLLDAAAPGRAAALPPGVTLQRDLHYGSGSLQTLDVYRPARAIRAPVILMVHGGGWRGGDKSMGRMVDSKVTRWVPRGFVFVAIDYGLLPGTPVSRQADDVAQAVAYVQQHASEWGADPRKLILMGHSAGAHLVAVLAADAARVKAARIAPWLGTIVLDSAALDVPQVMQRRHMRLYDDAFGSDAATWKALSPIDLLGAAGSPLLAVCSSTRPDDSCGQARRFVARASALGMRASVHEEALTHGEINFTLGVAGAYTDAVEAFMRSLDADVLRLLETKS